MKKVLVVVDYQWDFYHPDGALYVPGGEECKSKIEQIIPQFDEVIFTLDYHPKDHCSFVDNGGIWPAHCVEMTMGAEVPQSMYDLAKNYTKVYKGQMSDKEEYGAFSGEEGEKFLSRYKDCEIVVCGLAGNFCVLSTLKNILTWIDKSQVKVFMDGVRFIADKITMDDFYQFATAFDLQRYDI